MEIQNQKSGNVITNILLATFVGILIAGCTSSRIDDLTASSIHNDAPKSSVQTQPIVVNQDEQVIASNEQSSSLVRNDTVIEKNSQILQDNVKYAEPARSGVIYQNDAELKTRSLYAPVQTDEQTKIASLYSNSSSVFGMEKEIQAGERVKILDAQMKHETCKGGWATPPDKLDSSRITEGHRYYMEMRLRHTPLLPVGHTYIAYGRLSPSGKPLEERLIMLSPVGGYGGAAIAAALPMPGVLKPVFDDCKLKPIAAYRITLTAQQYEQLLLRIQKVRTKTPAYALFAYNCNHFASDIASAVGILPPKNKYLPALKYIYGVIEANEGYSPKGKLPT